tara:strand:+ start:278 stop:607 length:330 start_codon:yes stop_codon:yes gene_type:complete
MIMKKTIVIQKNVPIPTVRRDLVKRKSKWDFLKTMEVGDSAIVSTDTSSRASSTIANALYIHTPKQFTQRRTADGIRVWRVNTGQFYTSTERKRMAKSNNGSTAVPMHG